MRAGVRVRGMLARELRQEMAERRVRGWRDGDWSRVKREARVGGTGRDGVGGRDSVNMERVWRCCRVTGYGGDWRPERRIGRNYFWYFYWNIGRRS